MCWNYFAWTFCYCYIILLLLIIFSVVHITTVFPFLKKIALYLMKESHCHECTSLVGHYKPHHKQVMTSEISVIWPGIGTGMGRGENSRWYWADESRRNHGQGRRVWIMTANVYTKSNSPCFGLHCLLTILGVTPATSTIFGIGTLVWRNTNKYKIQILMCISYNTHRRKIWFHNQIWFQLQS